MPSHDSVLLETLAATGWFAEHGEVALTAGLTLCLEKDPAAARAFLRLIRDVTGHTEEDLPSPHRWQAESVDDNRMRVDIAGWSDAEPPAPIVFVEAKVSAEFALHQVSTYVVSQKAALQRAGVMRGVLAVLVPAVRVHAAHEEVGVDLEGLGAVSQGKAWLVEGEPVISVAVVSWDEALSAMLADADRGTCDLQQLLGACRALQGADVAAFTESDLAGGWQSRRDDLRLIIDRVARVAITELSLWLAPWQPNPSGGFEGGFRYLAPSDLPNLSVGMRVDGVSSPLWARWHIAHADLRLVESRLTKANLPVERHEGHLWRVLDIEPDVGAATRQIESLASQVVQLYKVAVDWTDPI